MIINLENQKNRREENNKTVVFSRNKEEEKERKVYINFTGYHYLL